MQGHLLLIISDTFHFLSVSDIVILVSILIAAFLLMLAFFRCQGDRFLKGIFSILCFLTTGILFAVLASECKAHYSSYIDQVITEINEDYQNGIIPNTQKDDALALVFDVKKMKYKGYYSNANYIHVKYKVKKLAEPTHKRN